MPADALLVAILVGAGSYLLFRWMRPTTTRRHSSDGTRLRYGVRMRLLSVGMVAACAAMDIAIAFMSRVRSESDRRIGLLLVTTLLLLTGGFVVEFFRRCATLAKGGVELRSPRGRRSLIPWDEIETIKYSPFGEAMIIVSVNKQRIWVSRYFDGLPEFREALLKDAPPHVLAQGRGALDPFMSE